MINKMLELQWEHKKKTYDGFFTEDCNGVEAILTPKDRRSEFILMESGEILVTLPYSSVPVYYPVKRHPFRPRAKAVLMDLDGTSIQSESFWIWIIEQTVGQLQHNSRFRLKAEDIPFVSGFSVSEHLTYCLREYHINAKLETARQIYFEITHFEMEEIMQGRGKTDAYTVTDGLKEFLMALKGNNIKIGLVTSGLYEKAMPEILSGFRQMGLGNPLEFYDAVITAGTTYRKGEAGTLGELSAKPHPWLYREICKVGLGIPEEEFHRVVVLEDSSAGVLAGYLSGFDVIGMNGGNIAVSGVEGLLLRKAESFQEVLNYILAKEDGQ